MVCQFMINTKLSYKWNKKLCLPTVYPLYINVDIDAYQYNWDIM